jgi:hypothetical protein
MKRFVFLLLPVYIIASNTPPMPPMIPVLGSTTTKNHTKNTLPDSCGIIPPMIYKLPPPLEDALVKCKNDLYKPDIKLLAKKFKTKIKKVKELDNFSQIYEISFMNKNAKKLYCNKDITFCFDTAPIKR